MKAPFQKLAAPYRMKDRIQGNKIVKALSLLSMFVMPIFVVDSGVEGLLSRADIAPYDLLCFGFYGSILLCLSWERKWRWLKLYLLFSM